MVLCDDLLKKQNWKDSSTKSITLNGQEELDCFTNDEDGINYKGGIILTGTFRGLVENEDGNPVHKENSIKTYQFIDDHYKNNFNFTSITIPPSVTSIGNYVFYMCSALTSVTIPPSVTFIGDYSFSECKALKSITIPPSVTSIGDSAFAGCVGLPYVTIPSSVTSIGYSAFYGCGGLTSVTINSNINMANNEVFTRCISLTKIILSDTLTDINADMFVGNGLDKHLINITDIEYRGKNIYNDKNFNMETKKMNVSLKRIRLKSKLKWIIPVSVVSALLLSFIVFKVVRRQPRKQNKKNTKKSKK
jgi:hypothetical protein